MAVCEWCHLPADKSITWRGPRAVCLGCSPGSLQQAGLGVPAGSPRAVRDVQRHWVLSVPWLGHSQCAGGISHLQQWLCPGLDGKEHLSIPVIPLRVELNAACV